MRRQACIHATRGGEIPGFESVVPGRGVGYCVIVWSENGIGDGACVGFEKRKRASLGDGY